ncbi:hypothetical protein FRB97_007266 [Tulasnella sp. 331]|nr:hypothetical protein FRB97_007266 [Tulasnella sp. 331]
MLLPKTPSHDAPYPNDDPTPIQAHTAFWDRDNDGVIWPSDIFGGCRELGYPIWYCFIAVAILNGFMSYISGDSWIPDPYFRIYIRGIHRSSAKHGSDCMTYTRKGLIDLDKFDEIFATYSDTPSDSLTFRQALSLIHGNIDPFDWFGVAAEIFEWGSLYLLLWPEDGRMSKEDIFGCYDGSLFWRIAAKNGKCSRAEEWVKAIETSKKGH